MDNFGNRDIIKDWSESHVLEASTNFQNEDEKLVQESKKTIHLVLYQHKNVSEQRRYKFFISVNTISKQQLYIDVA